MKQDKVHGEGNYKATRDYNESTKRFLESEDVDEAARRAAPRSPEEERQMKEAERIGRSRSKGEDEDPDLWRDEEIDDEERIEDENQRRSARD